MKKVAFDLDHILKVITPIIDKFDSYWGYEEKIDMSKKIYRTHNYLLPDDETIIETLYLFFDGTNSKESNTEKT